MIDYELSLPILLGAAFAAVYWLLEALITALPGVGLDVLLVVGPVMVILWAVGAGLASDRTLRDGRDVTRRTVSHTVTWVVLFTGMAVLFTRTVVAVIATLWPPAMETGMWFGIVLLSTTALGAVLILAGGGYRLIAGRRLAPGP